MVAAESRLEFLLGFFPATVAALRRASPASVRRTTRVRPSRLSGPIVTSLSRCNGPDGPANGGSVHHHLRGERIDGHRAEPAELRQDRVLVRAQAFAGHVSVVELGHLPRRLPQGQAIAGRLVEFDRGHGGFLFAWLQRFVLAWQAFAK